MNHPLADRDVLTAAMIATARARGLTWGQIGSVLLGGDRNPKLAKKHAKALARKANRKAALMLAEEDADA
jgi:hypothetical protein